MPDWLTLRTQARRVIHDAFSTPCTYQDDIVTVAVTLTVRWHAKPEFVGNINSGDYAEIFTTIHRLLFNQEEIDATGVTFKHGGIIKLINFNDYQFELDALEQPDGPLKVTWSVIHK